MSTRTKLQSKHDLKWIIYKNNKKNNMDKLNKYLIILALETILEHVKDAKNIERIKEVKEQIEIVKEEL